MSFLALPVIVFEGAGAVDGLKRSAALLEQTWGENVSFNLGLGVLGIALTAPSSWCSRSPRQQARCRCPSSVVIPLLVYALLAMGLYSACRPS